MKWGGKLRGNALWRRSRRSEVHGGVHKNSVPGKYPVAVPNSQGGLDLPKTQPCLLPSLAHLVGLVICRLINALSLHTLCCLSTCTHPLTLGMYWFLTTIIRLTTPADRQKLGVGAFPLGDDRHSMAKTQLLSSACQYALYAHCYASRVSLSLGHLALVVQHG